MLAKSTDDRGMMQTVTRVELDHGIEVPSLGPESVRIIAGRAVLSTEDGLERERLIQSLRESDRITLRKLFHTLAPPRMDALDGEYDAELLDQGGPISQLLTERMFGLHGRWLGKAFCPVSENEGVGYNYFQSGGKVVQKLLMTTTITTSTLDNGLVLKISYKARNRGLISWLFGEVRQVTPSVMLGVGIFGPSLGRRDKSRRKIPFILAGPSRPYQQSPGASEISRVEFGSQFQRG